VNQTRGRCPPPQSLPTLPLSTSNRQTETESIGQTKHAAKSYECQLSNKPSNVENAQNLGKNEPWQHVVLLHTPCLLRLRIDERKPNQSAKRNMLLKAMNVSFQMSPRTLRIPKIWARTNLGNMGYPSYTVHASSDFELSNENWLDQQNEKCCWKPWMLAFKWTLEHWEHPRFGQERTLATCNPPLVQSCLFHLELGNENGADRRNETRW
jgi:hypothetical protein